MSSPNAMSEHKAALAALRDKITKEPPKQHLAWAQEALAKYARGEHIAFAVLQKACFALHLNNKTLRH